MCHNPRFSDISQRPEGVGGGTPLSFAHMIHKIHTGEELNQDFTVYDEGIPGSFNELLFPGLRQACNICHVEDVPSLPLPEDVQPIDFTNKDGVQVHIAPTSAACTGCHDSREAIAHARLNTTPDDLEACAVCHQAGRSVAITETHALDIFLNVIERIGPLPTDINAWSIY